ncbi:hypothetical protein [Vibrio cyclitrophicus]|uniref:hypothetical protein n=1 Tax=Vibrio cyclitrophicus TaxID=47951 RepID=UPI001113209B|nr:hypothetical protein [Vibrio cyclitrophicus]
MGEISIILNNWGNFGLFLLFYAVFFGVLKFEARLNVEIDELVTKIREERESGHFSLQAIFNRNIQQIEDLKSEGYSYKVILTNLDMGLADSHFRDLIRKAKKKEGITQSKAKVSKADSPSPVVTDSPEVTITPSPIEVSEWEKIGINNPRVIKNIVKAQLTPEEVKSWGCANEMQISKRVTEHLIKMNKKGQ